MPINELNFFHKALVIKSWNLKGYEIVWKLGKRLWCHNLLIITTITAIMSRLKNLTPNAVYFGKGDKILKKRTELKAYSIKERRIIFKKQYIV